MKEQPERPLVSRIDRRSPTVRSPNRRLEEPPMEARIEDYLDHVYAPLVGVVPYARRQELRAELRSHLEALAAGYEEAGHDPRLAPLLAMRQFGNPGKLAHRWAREWLDGEEPGGHQPPWRAMLVALGSFGAATLVAGLSLWFTTHPVVPFAHTPGHTSALLVSAFLFPLLAGGAAGLHTRARHALGSFYALASVLLVTSVLALWSDAWPTDAVCPFGFCLDLALMQLFFWFPLGCGASVFGGWLRKRLALRPRRWVLQ